MNAYEYILDSLEKGMDAFLAALLSIYFYIIHNGTLAKNNMTEANLALVMTQIGWSYSTTTHLLTKGETSYTIAQAIDKAITDYYEKSPYVDASTMIVIINVCAKKGRITADEKTALMGKI